MDPSIDSFLECTIKHMLFLQNVTKHADKINSTRTKLLCENYDHFLDIAEAIRGIGLNILKGTTDGHGDKTWMHFIIESLPAKHIPGHGKWP
ncbi:hypothetical protein Dimus_016817 [Dionaea muscipula]